MKLCSWEFYLINTYLGNLKYRTLQGKSQLNQWALFTIKFLPNNTSLCTLCCSLVYPYFDTVRVFGAQPISQILSF